MEPLSEEDRMCRTAYEALREQLRREFLKTGAQPGLVELSRKEWVALLDCMQGSVSYSVATVVTDGKHRPAVMVDGYMGAVRVTFTP